MQVTRRIADGVILQYGTAVGPMPNSVTLEVDDALANTIADLAKKAHGGIVLQNLRTDPDGRFAADASTLPVVPDPPPPVQPNLRHALQALTNSNLDGATKQAIVDALAGR